VIVSSNFGQENSRTLAMMERFSAEVMPHFATCAKAA
jgi:hypothetical protein